MTSEFISTCLLSFVLAGCHETLIASVKTVVVEKKNSPWHLDRMAVNGRGLAAPFSTPAAIPTTIRGHLAGSGPSHLSRQQASRPFRKHLVVLLQVASGSAAVDVVHSEHFRVVTPT